MTDAIHSMTGFARCERETPIATLCWELRTVNHRYLDVSLRIHESLRPLEADLRALIGQHVNRGKVDGFLSVQFNDAEQSRVELDNHLLRSLRDASQTAEQVFRGARAPSVLELMKWPGVIRDQRPDTTSLHDDIEALLAKTLTALGDMRSREGAHLATTLLQRCDEIAQLTETIAARRPEVIAASQQRLRERLGKLDVETDPARIETELVLQAQKLDVDEELDRLHGHLNETRHIIADGSPCGRKLDFLMQEFNREANTIGSKSADGITTKATVDMKVAIEQMREQVQNIE